VHKNPMPSANNDQPARPPSLSKKSNNMNFYNSTYDSVYPINSSNLTNHSPLSQQQTNSFSTDDLAQLETFDEQSIITHMYNRFLANQIYTYIGDILVVSYLIILKIQNDFLYFYFLRLLIHFVHYQFMVKMP